MKFRDPPPPFHYTIEASQELVLRIEVAQELSEDQWSNKN